MFTEKNNAVETLTDEELLAAFVKNKNKSAFNEIYKRYSNKIGWFVMRICNNDNDLISDVVQESFFKLYQKANSFKFKSSFSSWFYRIALNIAITNYNKAKKNIPVENDKFVNLITQESTESNYIKKEEIVLLRKSIEMLPEKLKQVIILKIYHEMKYDDIANILNISLRTVKNRIKQAITEIHTGLKK